MCDRCELLEETVEHWKQMAEALEREVTMKTMLIGRLRAREEREAGEEQAAPRLIRLIESWKMLTGHSQAKVALAGKRADYIRKAWKMGYTDEQIEQVFKVASRFPYVDPRRSQHPSGRVGTGDTLRDDIPTLLKDEVTIDRLLSLANVEPIAAAANGKEEVGPVSVSESWRQMHYPRARVWAALWDQPHVYDMSDEDMAVGPCPVCTAGEFSAWRSPDGLISIECARGCEFWRLLAALNLEPADLFENAEHDPSRKNAGVPRTVPAHLQEAAGLLAARLSGLAGSGG